MGSGSGFRQLSGQLSGSGVCTIHRLLNYSRMVARMDAERLRREAIPGTPNSLARAERCQGTENWHIYIPTSARMKKIKKCTYRTKGQGNGTQ